MSVAMSRAFVRCIGSGSPCGFAKRVAVSPSSRAFSFMRATNVASSPAEMLGERGGGVVRGGDRDAFHHDAQGDLVAEAQPHAIARA